MKIAIHIEGETEPREASLPDRSSSFVVASGACPLCRHAPLHASGSGEQVTGHDTITSACVCRTCDKRIGSIVVTMDSLFGIEEDRRVLNGRCRVY